VHSEQDAKDLIRMVHKQELAGVNVVDSIRRARAAAPAAPAPSWPTLRAALPEYIRQMAAQGEWTGSTPINYGRRLARYVYDFPLADGRKLGDLRVDQVTEQMIGAVLDQIRTPATTARSGRSRWRFRSRSGAHSSGTTGR
jgi:hypothetical protein